MATRSISLQVASAQDMETMTMSYIARGFSIANKTPAQVTLIKKKQISVVWLLILIFFVWTLISLLLLAIYLIIYASESDQMVTITVTYMPAQVYTGQLAPQAYSGQLVSQPYSGQLAPPQTMPPYSGQFAGSRPLASSGAYGAPPSQYLNAPRSPDGYYWWDGQAWQPVPQAGRTGPMGQPPTDPAWPPPVDPMGY